MRTRTTNRGRAPIAALTLLGIALLVGACGGGASAADAIGDPDAQAAADVLIENVDDAPEGEYADEAWILGSIDALYARDSFTFEVETSGESSYGPFTNRVNGIVRPSDDAFVVNFDTEGSVSQYVTIGDESWIDYGDGQYRPQDVPDDSGNHVRELWDEYFASYADDFVIAGEETVHGRATVHAVIDPEIVENKVELFGEEYRNWTLDLWLAADDGHLVRAIYGGPQAPVSFSVPQVSIDVKSVDCECPVHDPS
jgi:hypothetical protein